MSHHHEGPHPEHTFHLESPSTDRTQNRHIVLGIGTGSSSEDALEFALSLAGEEDASLHIVHCISPEDMPVETDSPRFENRFRAEMTRQREHTSAALESHKGSWTYDCQHGDPAEVILSMADKYDAFTIVVGSPRRGPISAISQMMHSSVASRLTRQSKYPVVMVPIGVKSAR
ncbi:universal stress protein [Rhodococcus sp. IEGM 1379]|uniref:universal stress protein n=1 Tax=Rhodococcus sp. IEGM 1379 TaxID=3047086 RepID=UPI0024B805E3|nr:universal stress protein [Rhodococcus sp. IEGM 1379]MDI9917425.1 universal stress protein [Rhodococcus sp. IEGM 1379]